MPVTSFSLGVDAARAGKPCFPHDHYAALAEAFPGRFVNPWLHSVAFRRGYESGAA